MAELAKVLPRAIAEALAAAAAQRDHKAIDKITDGLAKTHPGLVRPRHDGSLFGSVRLQRMAGEAQGRAAA